MKKLYPIISLERMPEHVRDLLALITATLVRSKEFNDLKRYQHAYTMYFINTVQANLLCIYKNPNA
jgi:hypothetical protein